MKLLHCTITGADDNTNLDDLRELSREFPFVEWGILVGNDDRFGTPRFPSEEWRGKFKDYALPAAAHLCGKRVDAILEAVEADEYLHRIEQNKSVYRRLQLNSSRTDDQYLKQVKALAWKDNRRIIVPLNNTTYDEYLPIAWECTNVEFLFDRSGGRGEEMPIISPPVSGVRCGYAGGINPSNIANLLIRISTAISHGCCWIDMESHVRTDDKLDLDKVYACLSVAKEYI